MSKVVLYRKYRPQSFEEVLGQDHIVSVLKNAVKTGRVSHAYLFSGSRGTGKTSLARILAKALNCAKFTGKSKDVPCDKCSACISVNNGNSLDLIEIDAASNRGIDEIRELRDKVRYAPSSSAYKVYIIDEVHMLTKEAFNALLKTLEEPPAHCVFIMATTELHKVPDTILSRTQQFDFKRASQKELVDNLQSIAKKEKLNILIHKHICC